MSNTPFIDRIVKRGAVPGGGAEPLRAGRCLAAGPLTGRPPAGAGRPRPAVIGTGAVHRADSCAAGMKPPAAIDCALWPDQPQNSGGRALGRIKSHTVSSVWPFWSIAPVRWAAGSAFSRQMSVRSRRAGWWAAAGARIWWPRLGVGSGLVCVAPLEMPPCLGARAEFSWGSCQSDSLTPDHWRRVMAAPSRRRSAACVWDIRLVSTAAAVTLDVLPPPQPRPPRPK